MGNETKHAETVLLPEIKGDGVNDDASGIQALLDSGAGAIYLPKPKNCYLIGETLRIHSNQTLWGDR